MKHNQRENLMDTKCNCFLKGGPKLTKMFVLCTLAILTIFYIFYQIVMTLDTQFCNETHK